MYFLPLGPSSCSLCHFHFPPSSFLLPPLHVFSFTSFLPSPSSYPTFHPASLLEYRPPGSVFSVFTLCLLSVHTAPVVVVPSFPFSFHSPLPLPLVCCLPSSLPGAGGCCALQSPWLRAVDHREACVSERLMDGL